MTKDEILSQVGQKLGDTSTTFLTILGNIFDRVLEEMAANGCIKSLRRTATFSFVAGTRSYDTGTIAGLSTNTWPITVDKVVVPAWGPSAGILRRVEEHEFDLFRMSNTDSDGNPVQGQPRVWRLYPNERTLQVDPVPSSDYVITNGVEALYTAPVTALSGSSNITEIHGEHLYVIIAGMIKYGLVFQDETVANLFDAKTAPTFFEVGMLRMKTRMDRESGRTKRMRWRLF